jgi:toxin ParE1/3/4
VRRYAVRIIEDAEQDLIDIYTHVASSDSAQKADYVLEQLESLCLSLADMPSRGHVPPELDRIGVTAYREVRFKPYRVVYQVTDRDVEIHCVLDGRQDMQALLERRLLRTFDKNTPPAP